ncbi:MAG TPA: hypothetical protein VFZ24_05010 [Longimicrobiales bacterium]
MSCSDPYVPEPVDRGGITFLAPASTTDSIEAVVRVEIEVRGREGQPLSGHNVRFQARNGTVHRTSDAGIPYAAIIDTTSDEAGRASVYHQLAPAAGPTHIVVTVDRYLDSLRFDVLPGRLARLTPVPRDTALAVGRTYDITISPADRRGNARTDDVSGAVFRSTSPSIVVSAGGTVGTVQGGRGVIEIQVASITDTAHVSVVPPGTLAVIDSGVRLLDLESHAAPMIVSGATDACPSWDPDASRVLLRGLRLVTPDGTETFLSQNFGVTPGCGEFSRDGEWIYFEAGYATGGIPSEIWRIRPDGTGVEQITTIAEGRARSPSPSPDGTRVAYVAQDNNSLFEVLVVRDLATKKVDSISERIQVCCDICCAGGISSVRWSPTGEWIAYTLKTWQHIHSFSVRSWTHGSYIRLVSPDGLQLQHVAPAGLPPEHYGFLGGVSWSPDGEWLVGKAFYSDLRIRLVHVPTGDALMLNGSTRAYAEPAWRPPSP